MVDPGLPPYYNDSFISEIKAAMEKHLPVETMTSKSWYSHLLAKHITEKDELGPNGEIVRIPKKCKAEEMSPELNWELIWYRSRMKGILNETRSFFWRMFHDILPTQKRLNTTSRRVTSPNCILCDANAQDCIREHSFTTCRQSSAAMNWLLSVIMVMDPSATIESMVNLQIEPYNPDHLLECVWLIGLTMEYVWGQRKSKILTIDLNKMITSIRAKCVMFSRSSIFYRNATNLLSTL